MGKIHPSQTTQTILKEKTTVEKNSRFFYYQNNRKWKHCIRKVKMKYFEFLRIAELMNSRLQVIPLLYGSLGLERRLHKNMNVDDIDVLIPKRFLEENWDQIFDFMTEDGYILVDEGEHEFQKQGTKIAYADIEDLVQFAGIDITQIPVVNEKGATYFLLELSDYLKVYEASSKDGYRKNIRNKKDQEKIDIIRKAMKMSEVNKTLFIPLYGKAYVSRRGIILDDPDAERIWEAEGFSIKGKSKSRWLAYNMAMRARVFDDWTDSMLQQNKNALVLHIGCGLDSRCNRIRQHCQKWIDCDLPEVISVRRRYFTESDWYHMKALDASKPDQINEQPDSKAAIVVLEGLSMYLTNLELFRFLQALQNKYDELHILMDVYTIFGAKASKFKNPVNDVGVTELYGIDDIQSLLGDLRLHVKAEHTFTPANLVDELRPSEKSFFRKMFTGSIYRKIYRLYELET